MEEVVLRLSIVIVSAAVLGVAAHFLRQPLLVAYVLAGVAAGPYVLNLAGNPEDIRLISEVGIILLLFLVGIVLNPQRMLTVFREVSIATFASSAVFFALGLGAGLLAGLSAFGAALLGTASMFSSTVLAVKLLPAGKLHRQPIGTVCVGVLIIQDLLAVLALLAMRSYHEGMFEAGFLVWTMAKGIGLIVFAFLFARYALYYLLAKVERYAELIFVIALAWCFGLAELCELLRLSREIGAFIAGVSLATHPLAIYISQKIMPLRDFFIVLFFFALGAMLNLSAMANLALFAVALAVLFVLVKPPLIAALLRINPKHRPLAAEAGIRLGQCSEFSLIVATLGLKLGQIGNHEWNIITVSCLLTMIISTYVVVFMYPSPLGVTNQLKQN